MNTFIASALDNRGRRVRTENGGETFNTSSRFNVDLFFTIGALRKQGTDRLFRMFEDAYQENREYAIRTLLWARDIRGGAGERQIFRDVMNYLEVQHPEDVQLIIPAVATYGRYDDLLVFKTEAAKNAAYRVIADAIADGNGLCAKWMPRKGIQAAELRQFLGMTPKQYRKTLVNLTNVVETPMCAKNWDTINLEHVPSLAMTRYTKAFKRNLGDSFEAYVGAVTKGEAKVNTGAIYPYDIVQRMLPTNGWSYNWAIHAENKTELELWEAQWNALPNFLGEHNALAIIDVSGSMGWTPVSGSLYPIHVATSLGIYLADKQTGPFSDMVMTFHSNPKFVKLSGNLPNKVRQVLQMDIGGGTDIEAAFRKILKTAKDGNVLPEDMPRYLVILSDMEFDTCTYGTAFESVEKLYKNAGYVLPRVVFWNIQSRQDNVPVKFDQSGVALVSGFSPTVFKNVLNADNLNPESMMLSVIMNDRYNIFQEGVRE